MGLRSKMIAGAFACMSALSLAVIPAHAAEGNFVSFGDSIPADPTPGDYLNDKISKAVNAPGKNNLNCATNPNGFAAQAAARLNLDLADYSCAGASAFTGGQHISAQVDKAIADGKLNAGTKVVSIMAGFNDTYPHYINKTLSAADIRARYVGEMSAQINRIKAAAPQATIKTIGYNQITDGDFVCLVHVGGNASDRTFMPVMNEIEQLVQNMQRDTANATGTQFVDIKPSSAAHGICAPDQDRWISGVVDLPVVRNLPLHLTVGGHANTAEQIVRS
ncbi:hydrolase [Corynebacterium sp. sy017]|uniref:GDSL-type esterase/lipase family protein n=1 Tax=unclassified Corynebacterium TaxID=2624378 RepID=UPI001184FC64|nr:MULTISPECIES: GDSL-type esterase/lipase family protein [unclassified Corynebacterium]MBP3089260.1 hydrolase [Corynebacterium sp. sy017]QDZ43201.1 hydrolase [Corynebacterium sp. sy039]TSD91033.1 hydrolase [Corynebacterium sp. SY003]